MTDRRDNPGARLPQTVAEAWKKAEGQEFDTIGMALSAVTQLESALRRELKAKLERRDIPREYSAKILPLLDSYRVRLDPVVKSTLHQRSPKRIEGSGGYMVYDPQILFTVEFKASREGIEVDMDRFLDSLISLARPQYLKQGRTMKQFIRSLGDKIIYGLPGPWKDAAEDFSHMLRRTMESYLDVRFIDDPDADQIPKDKLDLYFDIINNPQVTEPFRTMPAITSPDKKDVIYQGTLLIPALNNNDHDRN